MKILVVVNNHNSIGVIKLCLKLRELDPQVEVNAICSFQNKNIHGAFFEQNSVRCKVLDLTESPDVKDEKGKVVKRGFLKNLKEYFLRKREQQNYSYGPLERLNLGITRLIVASSAFNFLRERLIFSRMKRFQQKALEYLNDEHIDIVCSLSDRSHDYVEGPVLWAAKRSGIKVVLPYIAQFEVDASLKYRCNAQGRPLPGMVPFRYPSLYKTIALFKFKKQMYKGFFFQEPFLLNAAKKCGVLSDYPWWVGNGNSDIVCVDSQYTAQKYKEHRVNDGKIAILGHVDYDTVFASAQNRQLIRETIFQQYSLDEQRKLIILSMPQYAEQGYISWEEHWKEIDELLVAIGAADLNVVVSIHPRSDRNAYAFIEQKHGFHIAERALAEIIGAADLFLASNSTTFSWAVLCGIPSIALKSPVRFLFDHLSTVIPEYDNTQLTNKIHSVMSSPSIGFDNDWALLSKDEVFDGQFNQRFLRVLQKACELKPH